MVFTFVDGFYVGDYGGKPFVSNAIELIKMSSLSDEPGDGLMVEENIFQLLV